MLLAPMPGVVKSVNCKVGDEVRLYWMCLSVCLSVCHLFVSLIITCLFVCLFVVLFVCVCIQ